MNPSQETDLFARLGLRRESLALTEREIQLELHPRNSGPLAGFGKTPVLVASRVRGTLDPDGGGSGGVRAQFRVAAGDFRVTSPEISASDRGKIEEAVREKILDSRSFPEVSFVLSELTIEAEGTSVRVLGALSMHGRSISLVLGFTRVRGAVYQARTTVLQSDFGIKPVVSFFGALRSEDPVLVLCTVDLTALLAAF